jgi:thiamine biosynthesis lipoprotein ApbE
VGLDGDSTLADAYATSLFVMGGEKSMEFLKRHSEIGIFAVIPWGEIHYNERFKVLVSGLDITR